MYITYRVFPHLVQYSSPGVSFGVGSQLWYPNLHFIFIVLSPLCLVSIHNPFASRASHALARSVVAPCRQYGSNQDRTCTACDRSAFCASSTCSTRRSHIVDIYHSFIHPLLLISDRFHSLVLLIPFLISSVVDVEARLRRPVVALCMFCHVFYYRQ